ncbi:MAG: hypothetical protein OSA08_10060 [Arenicellales bacterium]|nr:hypothetical protein [Arenicellales bacterium]
MGKRLCSQDALYNDLTMGDKPIVVHETISPGFECPGHTHSPDERAWSPRRVSRASPLSDWLAKAKPLI